MGDKLGPREIVCASIWQGALIGLAAGWWMGATEPMSNALAAAVLAGAAVAVHATWRRAWRYVWPTDFEARDD